MTDRERLIELLFQANDIVHRNGFKFNANVMADHLLANGVIVPPCKVGDTVWFIRNDIKSEIVETNIEKVVLKHGGLYIKLACNAMYETTCRSIGKTVFLTKEEAEQALKEREKV